MSDVSVIGLGSMGSALAAGLILPGAQPGRDLPLGEAFRCPEEGR